MNRKHDSTTSDPLGLRRLPPRRAPVELWSSIEQQLDQQSAPRSRARWPWAGAVAAALLTVLVLPRIDWHPNDATGTQPPYATVATTHDSASSPGATNTSSDSADDPRAQLRSARALSALLESELQRARGEVLRPADMNALVWTEAELRLTDDLLGDDPDNLELWHQRIALLGRMNSRYQQNDWRRQLQLTSL